MALPDLQLRSLVETDLLAYKALRDRMLADFPASSPPTPRPSAQPRPGQLPQPPEWRRCRRHAVHRRGSGPACRRPPGGALTAEREARQKVQHTAHLVGMMVAPDCQGRGIGRALLSETVARLRTEPGISL